MTDSPETPHAAADARVAGVCLHPLRSSPEGSRGPGRRPFRCPSCQQELSAPAAAGHGIVPPARQCAQTPVEMSGSLAVDRLSASSFRSVDDPALAIPEEGIRVRKRKRRSQQVRDPAAILRSGRPIRKSPMPRRLREPSNDWEDVQSDHGETGGAGGWIGDRASEAAPAANACLRWSRRPGHCITRVGSLSSDRAWPFCAGGGSGGRLVPGAQPGAGGRAGRWRWSSFRERMIPSHGRRRGGGRGGARRFSPRTRWKTSCRWCAFPRR